MSAFDDWWKSLGERKQSICIALIMNVLKSIPEAESRHVEEVAATILSGDHPLLEGGEQFRFMVEFIERCEVVVDNFDFSLEERGIVSRSDVLRRVELDINENIEIKTSILGLVLKESNDLAYLAERALKIINNAVVDHEGDIAKLEEESKQVERELFASHGTDQYIDLEMGEFLEWEIDLAGCPNLHCQYNNPPGAETCRKCQAPLLGECPECYNEIPINSNYCRVCGKKDLEEWSILQRFILSLEMALEQENYTQAASLGAHIPEEISDHPEIMALKKKLFEVMPSNVEERQARINRKIEDLCDRWIAKLQEMLAEKRPDFIIASQALESMPTFLKNEKMAELRENIDLKRRQVMEESRTRKRDLLIQQVDIFQEKGQYQEALDEINKLLPALHDENILKKKEELEESIAEVEKLKARLQGPSWAFPNESQRKAALRGQLSVAREFDLGQNTSINFILIPSGSFQMGSESGYENEKPVHLVKITSPFYLAISPVTQAQWTALLKTSPFRFSGEQMPAEQVSWQDCCSFVIALTKKFGEVFRLPTEAEWEYACRAESDAPYCFANTASLSDHAWFKKNSDKQTHPVCSKKNNKWGLYDMHGNVWEWCQDCYDENYYSKSTGKDPMGPLGNNSAPRVCRGGSWNNIPSDLRCSARQSYPPGFHSPNIGFRPVLVIK